MAVDPRGLSSALLGFLTERHLATLTTLRADGRPHVVPVGFTWDDEALVARVITSRRSRKAQHAAMGTRAVLCQVQGRRWVTLEGTASLHGEDAAVRDAERRYAKRYREPRPNPERIVLEVAIDAVLGDWTLS